MDKSRMTFTFRPSRQESPAVPKEARERRPFQKPGRFDRPEYRRNRNPYEKRANAPIAGFSWLIPALLATVTGLTLGLGVLFVFKNATPESKPTVTTVNPAPTTGTSAAAQSFPGLELVAYQVGAYENYERAKKGAAEFEKFGIHPVFRNSDKIQLFIGVAADKTQGQAVADAFNQAMGGETDSAKPPFYVRDYKVETRQGVIQGVAAQDAAKLAAVLAQTSQILKDGVSLAVAKTPQKEAADAWSKRIETLRPQMETARKILDKAGRKGEVARLDDIVQQLQETAAAMGQGKGVLEVQRHLVQSIVDYEELIGKLAPATG
ncbi:hypothetical protein [Effusibacillus pohliae]|uniref:hypothetical protein n=1 Tax=Effusibacillus pohliae TaxID=232270 RepID=UPI00035E0BBE|nr:hypothetical protein [Effusibacillus pohliae]